MGMKEAYFEVVHVKMEHMKGPAGRLAAVLRRVNGVAGFYDGDHDCGGAIQSSVDACLLSELLFSGNETMDQVLDSGLSEFFCKLTDGHSGDLLCKLVLRLPEYLFIHYTYRRSYRSKSLEPYYHKIHMLMNSVYFNWTKFDLREYLYRQYLDGDGVVMGGRRYRLPNTFPISELIALEIDEGNQGIVDMVREIIASDNRRELVDYDLILGAGKSHNREIHEVMKNLLLDRELEEGLRKKIFETANDGCVEYFVMMIKTILDNNLLRFPFCIWSIDVWMGLSYTAETVDKQVIEKLLRLVYEYFEDKSLRREALDSKDAIEMYVAMYVESVLDLDHLYSYIERYMQGEKYQKLVALYMLAQTGEGKCRTEIAGQYLNETDMDVMTLVQRCYYLSTGWADSRSEYKEDCLKNTCLKSSGIRKIQFDSLNHLFEQIPEDGYRALGKPFGWCYHCISRESVFHDMLIITGYEPDQEKIEILLERARLVDSESRNTLIKYILDPDRDNREREFLFKSLGEKNVLIKESVLNIIRDLSFTLAEIQSIENVLALQKRKIRQSVLDIIKNNDSISIIFVADKLILDNNANKRLGALELISSLFESGELTKEEVRNKVALMPKKTKPERMLFPFLDLEVEKF